MPHPPAPSPDAAEILIQGAEEHNLQGFDLRIPRGRLTVITGVSGSGKSSLAFDTLYREGQRRFLESLPSFTRQFLGRLARPRVRAIQGLGPAVALGQRTMASNPRSTVGTLTETWDLLRLLYARLGTAPEGVALSRGLFSFNGEEGACPRCQGLGLEDRLDLELLVADPARTLREGALRVSTPNGYLMYSQVTLAVLDQVLRAHGGSVDIPWRELGDEARQVVLYGSERLKVPYGKHPLESRLTWTGITARPRPEGFYRGLVPVMEEILRGKRNDSILRFVRTSPCGECAGKRLRAEALAVTWRGAGIADLAARTVTDLRTHLESLPGVARETPVLAPIRAELLARLRVMEELGLGYLTLDRPAPGLSRGEAQRLRLVGLAQGELQGLLVVLDEPSAGLHPQEVGRLIGVLHRLRNQGQTVVVVEHDAAIARAADWLIDLGPGPGPAGGRLLWSGPPQDYLDSGPQGEPTPTQRWLRGPEAPPRPASGPDRAVFPLEGLDRHNLQRVALPLRVGALNVASGPSGAGKTSLLEAVAARLREATRADSPFQRLVSVDAEPIGRTPRSNPATYTGASDLIRDLFAGLADAKARHLGKGHFSFNTAGGRCEACEGAGVQEVGMRFLGTVERPCDACGGRRFQPEVLDVRHRGRTIAEVLDLSVDAAAAHFSDQPRLRRILGALQDVGLGYLPLGQPATTLSGGEAQRVKLATELARAGRGAALILLDEPTTGLHAADVATLLQGWERLLEAGHTLLVAEHDLQVLRRADFILDLGPGGGPDGGRVVASGPPAAIAACLESATGAALRESPSAPSAPPAPPRPGRIELRGVRTHNLQGFDLALPVPGFTVVTGPSGSGKSSLVFDTLLAEAQNRFADLVSPWARRLLPQRGGAELAEARGLRAALAVPSRPARRNPRSTVGTATELDGLLRLLFARAGIRSCPDCGRDVEGERCACGRDLPSLWAADFSPLAERGACPACRGLGFHQDCEPERLVSHPDRPLDGGAMDGTKFGAYLGEPDGQFVATLRQAAREAGLDVSLPWKDLEPAARDLAMAGTGEREYTVAWQYRRGRSQGMHTLRTPWAGFARLVEREYERVHGDARGEALEALLGDRPCEACGGERLKAEARSARVAGRRLPELARMPLGALRAWCRDRSASESSPRLRNVWSALEPDLVPRLEALEEAGLGYLALDREMASLSGGEVQRLRLAASLTGGLSGVAYVLDEPSRGLHPRDIQRLARVLQGLAAAGNAVIAVEHEPTLLEAADHLVELGPGAGPEGGRLMAQGSPEALKALSHSRTGARLRRRIGSGGTDPGPSRGEVRVRGATLHNLRDLSVAFPLGRLVAVTGVSGSGKSTLVQGVLATSLARHGLGQAPHGCTGLEVPVTFQGVLAAAQAVGIAGPVSTVLTLAGLAEPLRRRFAATPEAKRRKLTARHFATAAPGGRCEACEGRGVITVAMDLLPDVTVGCEACQGQRFRPEVLACRVAGRTLPEWLETSVDEALEAFAAEARLRSPLAALRDAGLGYLTLGQEARALSEGEAQRLRLAALLAQPGPGPWALLLDEPTQGLGFEDADRLRDVLRRRALEGHLVVAVTHDPEFIAACDWVIDLGPEGGDAGGRLVVEGPPGRIAACAESHTGQALVARGLAC